MTEEERGRPATKLVVDAERLKRIAGEKGLKSVEAIMERSREMGKPIALATIYAVLGGENFKRDTIERLAEVLEVDLNDFVSFEVPDS